MRIGDCKYTKLMEQFYKKKHGCIICFNIETLHFRLHLDRSVVKSHLHLVNYYWRFNAYPLYAYLVYLRQYIGCVTNNHSAIMLVIFFNRCIDFYPSTMSLPLRFFLLRCIVLIP